MSAASSRPPAARTRRPRTRGLRTPGLRARLPWWAPALAVVSFTVLLALVASPSRASAASAPQGLAPLLELLARLLGIGA
ncbi:hypothetical protein ACF05W_05305 [Streptomyces lydicus]|uniref:hypothetical protein n=1 Tax=Streptomyces lydicus TaxID=47763 RepID=UPI0037001141